MQALLNKSYDNIAGIYYLLLERWRKAHNKQGVFQSIVAPSSPAVTQCDNQDNDVILVETPSPPHNPSSPDSPIPVVQVTPVSPTVPANVQNTNTILDQHAHEVDDEMPHDMRADVKQYLERKRHTMANPCGMPEQPVMGVHMPMTLPHPGNYSPEKRLPAPSIFQMQAFQDRRASDGAVSLAAGIAQFQAMHERRMQASQADNSRDNLFGSSGLHALASSSPPSPQAGEEHDSGSDPEPDADEIARYMRLRGHKRHTLAGASDIPPEIRLCQLPMKMQRRVRTPSRERVNREGSYVGVPVMGMGRYGVRRASDGAASLLAFTQHLERKGKKGSLKEIHAEHQKLQQRFLNNGQHDVLKLQQQHQFHQQQQHQQLPSPVQQRSQHTLLPVPPSFRRLKDPRGRRFSDGPENLAATLAEFHNQLSLSQQKKQLQSIESQHPLTLSSHSPASPGSIPTANFPMDEEMQERNEMFPGPDHLPDKQPALDPGHVEDVIHPLPIPSPAHADVYSPQTSPREMLGMLHHTQGGAQPQEQLQQEMQRLQLEPMAGHLNSTNPAFGTLGNNVLLPNQNQGFQSPSSPEGFPRPFLGPLQGEEQFYETETAANLESLSGSLEYNAQGSPFHVEKRGDISPEELTGTEPFPSTAINQHFLLHQNQVNGHQEFTNPSSFIQNTSTAPLAGDIEVRTHSFMDDPPPGSRSDHLTTSAYAATLNAEAGNSANLSRGVGHHRRHHTVPNDEARNDLLRQAQANNLYKRLPFNNNLISPVTSKEDILGEDGHLARPLSPNGSLFTDPMIKLEGTNGFTSPTTPNHMTLAFNMNMISRKSLRSILDEVRNTLDNRSVRYKQSDLLFTLQDGEVQMQIEVCQSPELAVNGLRLRRLCGDTWEYKRLCNELLSGMNL